MPAIRQARPGQVSGNDVSQSDLCAVKLHTCIHLLVVCFRSHEQSGCRSLVHTWRLALCNERRKRKKDVMRRRSRIDVRASSENIQLPSCKMSISFRSHVVDNRSRSSPLCTPAGRSSTFHGEMLRLTDVVVSCQACIMSYSMCINLLKLTLK